jgi:putative transposase
MLALCGVMLYNVFVRQDYKSNHNVMYSCKYHVVFCPKYRRKVLTGQIAERLKEIVQGVADETESEILEIEVMPDHVHLLCEVDPQFGIAKFVRLCKGRSSRLLRQEFPTLKTRLPTLWTNSWFCSTVGGAPLSVVKQYIEQQKRSETKNG